MRSKCLFLLFLISLAYIGVSGKNHSSRPKLKRNDFPEDFIFGSATSAYQVFSFLDNCLSGLVLILSSNLKCCFVKSFRFCSVKVLPIKMAEDQVSGTHTRKNSQVFLHNQKPSMSGDVITFKMLGLALYINLALSCVLAIKQFS